MNTKEQILRVAFNLFLQKGYREVSLKEIVYKVGLTKGAFYHYFSGKEQLFREVVERYLLEGGEAIYESIPKDNLKTFMTSYLERIVEFIDQIKREMTASDSEMGVTYFYMALDALRLLPGFAERMEEMHRKERETWIEVIRNSRERGEIASHLSDKQLAKMFVGVNDGIGMHLILEGRVEDVQGEVFSIWNGIYNLIKK